MPRARSRRRSRSRRGLLGGHDRVVGVDAFGQVPQPLAAFPPGDRDLAARDHEVEQLGDVLVVGPAGGGPRPVARVGQLAGLQRALGAQPAEDVAAAPVVRLHPVAELYLPALQLTGSRPGGHPRAVEREVLGGAEQGHQLDQLPFVHRLAQVGEGVRRAEPAPGDQVGARRDGAHRVQLEQGEPPRHGQQAVRPVPFQQLRLDRQPPGVLAAELVHFRHGPEPMLSRPRGPRQRTTS